MQLMNMKELMEFLKVKRSTIYKLREDGLPVIHLGRVVRFDREEIIRWLKTRQRSDPPPRPDRALSSAGAMRASLPSSRGLAAEEDEVLL